MDLNTKYIRTCHFSMQRSLQNGIIQEFLSYSTLFSFFFFTNMIRGFSQPDPARTCMIYTVLHRSTHLRAFLPAPCYTNKCWACVHLLHTTDLCKMCLHALVVVKVVNGGIKLSSHFW